jgi:hypothetical protein
MVVVILEEALQGAFELATGGEVSTPEGDPPVLVEDRTLQTLHESVGPSVSGTGACVANLQTVTGCIEVTAKLTCRDR